MTALWRALRWENNKTCYFLATECALFSFSFISWPNIIPVCQNWSTQNVSVGDLLDRKSSRITCARTLPFSLSLSLSLSLFPFQSIVSLFLLADRFAFHSTSLLTNWRLANVLFSSAWLFFLILRKRLILLCASVCVCARVCHIITVSRMNFGLTLSDCVSRYLQLSLAWWRLSISRLDSFHLLCGRLSVVQRDWFFVFLCCCHTHTHMSHRRCWPL